MPKQLKATEYSRLHTRTRQEAENVCRWYAADRMLIDNLEPETFIEYMKMLCDAAENGSHDTGRNEQSYKRHAVMELMQKGLISGIGAEFKNVEIIGWKYRQRKSDSSKERVNKFQQKKFKQLCESLRASVKPDGIPEDAVVWGGNNKRWGTEKDVRLAQKLSVRVKSHWPDFELGITAVNVSRLITMDTGIDAKSPRKAYMVIDEMAEAGVKSITMDKVRREIKRKYGNA